MSNQTTKFKVTLEFEVDINPIAVPDAESFEKLRQSAGAKALEKPISDKEMRAGLRSKGMTEADIDKYMAQAKKGGAKKGGAKTGNPKDFQMLLYPEYEAWSAAQRALQEEILGDDTLCSDYLREVVRDLTRNQIEKLIDDRYGAADLNSVLKSAMQKLPKPDQAILKSEEESLLHDETELVDNSVDYRFAGVTVHRL
ncbi:MAG: hypothetical protein HOA00_00400 [Rhodospirillaceae bacterium]|jgi:hypothetical protein|nr:hypothetical protein [Rhodospirillaceae bacterium]